MDLYDIKSFESVHLDMRENNTAQGLDLLACREILLSRLQTAGVACLISNPIYGHICSTRSLLVEATFAFALGQT